MTVSSARGFAGQAAQEGRHPSVFRLASVRFYARVPP
jgi:hypothetical protein